MKNENIIDKAIILDTIRSKIETCFGESDGNFALHQLDEERAKELILEAKANNVNEVEFLEISSYYMLKKYPTEHFKTQLETISNLFRQNNN